MFEKYCGSVIFRECQTEGKHSVDDEWNPVAWRRQERSHFKGRSARENSAAKFDQSEASARSQKWDRVGTQWDCGWCRRFPTGDNLLKVTQKYIERCLRIVISGRTRLAMKQNHANQGWILGADAPPQGFDPLTTKRVPFGWSVGRITLILF